MLSASATLLGGFMNINISEQTKKWKEKIKSFGVKEWIAFLIVGVCCLIIVVPTKTEQTDEKINPIQEESKEEMDMETNDYVTALEQRLTNLLSFVEDVGKVKVMITVESTTSKNVLQDGSKEMEQSNEHDSTGGSRTVESTKTDGTTVFSQNEPYVLYETYPKVTGVVVIAQGSGIGSVDYDILNAVQVLFDVPAHKIKIMKMK